MYKIKENLEEVRERRKFSHQGMVYSVQRLDLLIVSICGAGIYIFFESLKYNLKEQICNHWIIYAFGIMFTLGLVANFIAQWCASRSHYYDFLYCQQRIDAGESTTPQQKEEIDKSDIKSEKYNNTRKYYDLSSMILMFLGLICLVSYFLFIF